MNWSRAKNILIIFFLCVNIFLLLTITMSTRKTTIITDDIIASTVAILKNNEIEIDNKIIPQKNQPLPLLEAKNIITDYKEFSEKLLKGEAIKGNNDTYSNQSGAVSFSGNRFFYTPSSPACSDITKKIVMDNARQIGKQLLKEYGLDLSNTEFTSSMENSKYTISVSKKKNSEPHFSSRITMTVSPSGLEKMSGIWFEGEKAIGEKELIKSMSGVLIDYISKAPKASHKIDSIQLGYYLPDEVTYKKVVTLIPCWQINSTKGSYLMDAIE